MTPADWAILAAMALALCAALCHIWKNRGKGGCGGSCSACPHNHICSKKEK